VSAAALIRRQPVAAVHTPTQTVLLHLAPGAAAFAAYLGLVPVAGQLGLPSAAALATVGLLVIPPVQLGLLRAHRRQRPLEPAVELRARLPLPRLLGWAALEVVLAGAAFLRTAPLVRLLQARGFAWWPDAWTVRLGTEGGYSDTALVVTAGLLLVGTVLVAPVVEELYFRGHLLPRMPHQLGPWKVPTHVALFAGYHLWTPWMAPTRILAVLPLAYVALRTRDVRVGIVAHVLLNATDMIVLLAYLSAR
jgi:membrane protease YdiL (CAAX protease family)